MKIAAQLYTVREFTQSAEDLRETFRKISEIGYESVQVSAIGNIPAQTVKKYADEFGLDICSTHTSFDRIVNDTDSVIEEHKIMGCKYIGLGGISTMWEEHSKEELKKIADDYIEKMTPAIKKIKAAGMKFLHHNHATEFQHLDKNITFIDYILDEFNADEYGLLVDFYWTQLGGLSYEDVFEKYSDRLYIVHFKDLLPQKNEPKMSVVGEGNINYKAIYKKCVECGVEVACVEQDDCNKENPFDCLKRSFLNIEKYK